MFRMPARMVHRHQRAEAEVLAILCYLSSISNMTMLPFLCLGLLRMPFQAVTDSRFRNTFAIPGGASG